MVNHDNAATWIVKRIEENLGQSARTSLLNDARAYVRDHFPAGVPDEELDLVHQDFVNWYAAEGSLKAAYRGKPAKDTKHSVASEPLGSLDNIQHYRWAIGPAVQLRKRLLGQLEPLSMDDAKEWLANHAGEVNEVFDLTVSFEIRKEHDRLMFDLATLRRDDGSAVNTEPLEQLVELVRCGDIRMVAGPKKSAIGYVHYDHNSVPLDRGPLLDLARGCKRNISPRLGSLESPRIGFLELLGIGSLESLCGSLNAAVWLVLCGTWLQHGIGYSNHRVGGITLKVRDTDASPGEVARVYGDYRSVSRKLHGHSDARKGRRPTPDQEVLGLIAIECREVEGTARTSAVLDRWKRRAPAFGRDPKKYRTPGAVRKALRRLEKRAWSRTETLLNLTE